MKIGFKRAWGALLSWPKPPGAQRKVACHYCDTLHHASHLKEGMAARCSRCDAVLYQNRPASLVRSNAFSLTALLLMGLAPTAVITPVTKASNIAKPRYLPTMNSQRRIGWQMMV